MAQPAHTSSVAAGGRPTQPSAPQRPAGDEARRSFLRMVSHELRTPLNSIIGFSEILSHELCGPLGAPQYKEYAGLIGQSGHRLLALVNQILEIVRLEGQGADLDIAPERLEPLVDDAFCVVREEADARGVTLTFRPAGGLPDALVDARALQTVLVNLLHNAIAHSPAGGEVAVGAGAAGDRLRLWVQDQGPGVDPEDIPRLMRPFEQGEQALTRRSQGAGLGLPIVRLLCEAMNGQLQLDSAPGQGLTATATLPAA